MKEKVFLVKNMTNSINISTNNIKDKELVIFKKEDNKVKNEVNTEFSSLFQNMNLDLVNNINLDPKKEISKRK